MILTFMIIRGNKCNIKEKIIISQIIKGKSKIINVRVKDVVFAVAGDIF